MAIDDANLKALAKRLRRDSISATSEAGSGHPTTCMSAADLVAVLFGREMALDPRDPNRAGTLRDVPRSGKPAELLAQHRIGADAIVGAVRRLRA